MLRTTLLVLLASLISQISSAPQFISFKDGKIGVNFGGYHAGVGFGGSLGGTGAGGLYAEAGTPHGQSAVAGLGGSISEHGGQSGGLFAGATAGNGIKASAGLAGEVNGENSAGAGYASAQAGNNYAATGMGGETFLDGASGFKFTSTKEVVVPVHKNIHTEVNIDSINEVNSVQKVPEVQTVTKTEVEKKVVHENVQPVIVKEVYVAPKTKVIEKEIIHTHYKPRKHHFRKTAFLGGYIGGEGDIVGPPVQPQIHKRIDIDAQGSSNVGVAVEGNIDAGVSSSNTYTKQVTVQKTPSFFEDIFNIPISTLKAVGSFLGNTASNTRISVQKSASVDAESGSISPKHASPSESSSLSSSSISIKTPTASKFIDDIFAIPINTLGAVNKFLQNNVAGRKTVQVSEDGTAENSRVRFGHGRKRANKRIVVLEEEKPEQPTNK